MKKEKIYTAFIFTFLILLCSYPLFINLGKLSLRMWDESRNAINALEMLHNHNFLVTYFDGQPDMLNTKPPFLTWGITFFMKLIGPSELAVRLPSALSALLIIIVCFWFSKKYLKSILPGFFAGIILSTSVGFIDYHVARNGDFDALLSMWAFFYCIFFFLYLETGKLRNLQLFSLFITFAILTKAIAACLFLPGLFLFLVINKKYWCFFKKLEFYIYPLLGLLAGLSYFFIRELYNPGFIRIVIENDVVGRYSGQYLETIGDHAESIWFYLQLMHEHQFSFWLPFVPFAVVITLLSKNSLIKNWGAFLSVVSILFLLIISKSYSKLPWYDAPAFPFLAALIGLGLAEACFRISDLITLKSSLVRSILLVVVCIGLFINPIQRIFATTILAEKETYFPELFYGDFVSHFYNMYPQQKVLNIVSEGYNPHLTFYQKVKEYAGYKINIIPPYAPVNKNDTIMVCEKGMWPKGNGSAANIFDTIYQEDDTKFILRLDDGSGHKNYQEKKLILRMNEIRNNVQWYESIKEKAKKNNRDLDKQIMIDALWSLHEQKLIDPASENNLILKYNLGE